MAIKLGKYSFTGPIASIDKLKDRSGVYAIVCKVESEYFLLDVGESSKLRTRIENHDKKDCWIKNCKGQLTDKKYDFHKFFFDFFFNFWSKP